MYVRAYHTCEPVCMYGCMYTWVCLCVCLFMWAGALIGSKRGQETAGSTVGDKYTPGPPGCNPRCDRAKTLTSIMCLMASAYYNISTQGCKLI